jgi:hypothetical protein
MGEKPSCVIVNEADVYQQIHLPPGTLPPRPTLASMGPAFIQPGHGLTWAALGSTETESWQTRTGSWGECRKSLL